MHPILVSVGAVWLTCAAAVFTGLHLATRRWHPDEDRSRAHAEAIAAATMARSAEGATDFRQWDVQMGRAHE
jgi:hypothetical protein